MSQWKSVIGSAALVDQGMGVDIPACGNMDK